MTYKTRNKRANIDIIYLHIIIIKEDIYSFYLIKETELELYINDNLQLMVS